MASALLWRWAIPSLLFFIFVFSILQLVDKILPISGFEPRISAVRSDCSTKWATTTAQNVFISLHRLTSLKIVAELWCQPGNFDLTYVCLLVIESPTLLYQLTVYRCNIVQYFCLCNRLHSRQLASFIRNHPGRRIIRKLDFRFSGKLQFQVNDRAVLKLASVWNAAGTIFFL